MFQVVIGVKVQILVSVRGFTIDGDLSAAVIIDVDASVKEREFVIMCLFDVYYTQVDARTPGFEVHFWYIDGWVFVTDTMRPICKIGCILENFA